MKIKTLPDHLISKIAAGEVIERPAYAVKELLENALDANADTITVEIEQAGLKRICVSDNGHGMAKDDLLESFKLHTTSKVTGEDLIAIKSLGFRGEALSSIAAVSTLTISSKPKNETIGHQVQIKGSELLYSRAIGMPSGTTVTVENLFFNVPSRKHFLKSLPTEFRHILEIVTQNALAFSEVRFVLKHNSKVIFDLPKNQSRDQRIKALLGAETHQHFLPIAFEDGFLKLSGFIAKPQISTSSLQKQFLFVNNRRVFDKGISASSKQAYGNLLEVSSYPLVVLYLQLPSEMVDSNVHPRKEQVNFLNASQIFEAVLQAITQTLKEHNLTYQSHSMGFFSKQLLQGKGSTKSLAGKALKKEVLGKDSEISQFHNLYLITQTSEGVVLIDQHAAHERVLYEQYLEAFKNQMAQKLSKTLDKPPELELSLTESHLLQEYLPEIEESGFKIENIGHNKFKITHAPEILSDRNLSQLLKEILEDYAENLPIKEIDQRSQRMLYYLACRSAIKAGESLSQTKRKELLKQLSECKTPYTCPHGRPTQIAISLEELEVLFKRH